MLLSHVSAEAHATTRLSVASSSECPKCGIVKKSGTRSCCAPGGAWFNNCGDAGDTQLDHTWAEGVQACRGFAASSVKTPLEVTIHQVEVIAHPFNTDQQENVNQQQKNFYLHGSASNAGTTGYKDRVGMAQVVVWICVILTSFALQTPIRSFDVLVC